MRIMKKTQALFDVQANVVAVYPLQGLATEHVPDWLDDFTDHLSNLSLDHSLFQALPSLKTLAESDEWPSNEDFLDALQFGNEKGFIFKGEWEIRRYIDEVSFVGGPGYRRIFWTYADDIDGGFDAIIAAAASHHAAQKAKAGAA